MSFDAWTALALLMVVIAVLGIWTLMRGTDG